MGNFHDGKFLFFWFDIKEANFFIIKIEWEISEPLNLEEFLFLWKFSQLSFNSESLALKILLNILFPPFHVKLNVWGNFLCSISTRQSCKCFFSLAAFFYCLVANATTWSRIFYFILCLKSGITMILMIKVRVWWEWKTEKVERFIGDGNFLGNIFDIKNWFLSRNFCF